MDDVVVADVAPDGADGQWAGGEEGTAAGRRGTRTDGSGSALAVRLRASVPSSMARTQIRRCLRLEPSFSSRAGALPRTPPQQPRYPLSTCAPDASTGVSCSESALNRLWI